MPPRSPNLTSELELFLKWWQTLQPNSPTTENQIETLKNASWIKTPIQNPDEDPLIQMFGRIQRDLLQTLTNSVDKKDTDASGHEDYIEHPLRRHDLYDN